MSPASLSEPWRTYAVQAEDAKKRFDQVVATVKSGPLRERLQQLSGRLDDGIDESWRIARRGHELVGAIGKIDTDVGRAASSPSCAARSARASRRRRRPTR